MNKKYLHYYQFSVTYRAVKQLQDERVQITIDWGTPKGYGGLYKIPS